MNNDGVRLQVSYLTLRRVVGVLGVSLPLLLALGGFVLCSCIGRRETERREGLWRETYLR